MKEKYKFEYRNSKFSDVESDNSSLKVTEYAKPELNKDTKLNYTQMSLWKDPHFNDVLVNTNYSSVHVPTNIFDRCKLIS